MKTYAEKLLERRGKLAGSRSAKTDDGHSSHTALLSQPDKWPEPLDDAALYGLAGEIVETIDSHTEADRAAVLIQAMVCFGNILGRTAFFQAEADKHHGNLFTVLVGKSAKGRKGASLGQVRRLFSKVSDESVTAWLENCQATGAASGEGLIWAVRNPIVTSQPVKEKGRVVDYQDVVTDPGVADKRLLVVESEFARVLKVIGRETNTLSPVIRDAWDTGNLRNMTKNSPARATGAHISIIGHITQTELRRLLTESEAANGFGNRFLWVCVKRSKVLPEGGRLRDADLATIAARLARVIDFARGVEEMRRTDEARQVWADVYPELSADRYGLFGSVTTRAESQTMRLACLYALLDGSPVVDVPHLLAGLAVWKYCEDSARFIFGDSLGDSTADELRHALAEAGRTGMSRTDIRDYFGRHRTGEEIARALKLLRDAGEAVPERIETGGRPSERWILAEGATEATKATEGGQ